MTARPDDVDVLLVSMPFGPLRIPSIGLELLKGSLVERRARILYCTLGFARRIGPDLYDEISGRLFPERSLVGEWLFSAALHCEGDDPSEADRFFKVASREAVAPVPAGKLDELLRARREVEPFLAECDRRIASHRPRVVGFTSSFQQHTASLALARRLKAHHPELFLVFGGANCEEAMGLETVRQFPFVDAVVSGEGDLIFPTLVDRALDGLGVDDLQGVYTPATAGRIDARRPPNAPRVTELDALPYPDYDDFFTAWQEAAPAVDPLPWLPIETSRGCWWGDRQPCTFCGLNGASMTYRSKSAARALDELEAVTRRHPGVPVMAVDSILDMRFFRDLLPALAEAEPSIELFEVKANLRKDQLRLLRAAGVRTIVPGIESLSDAVLGLMRKGVRALDNIQLLKWCTEIGIWPRWYLLWGVPGEPAQEYRRMAERIPFLSHLPPPKAANRFRLHRFSPYFEQADELGLTAIEPCPAYDYIYRLPRAAIRNLAFTFNFRHRDGRDVDGYTREVAERVAEWKQIFAASDLFYTERSEELWIWDLRPVAARPLTRLSGLAKALYRSCDQVRSIPWLTRRGGDVSRSRVEDVIGPLVEQGLMARDDDRVLSLAIAGKPQR